MDSIGGSAIVAMVGVWSSGWKRSISMISAERDELIASGDRDWGRGEGRERSVTDRG